MACFKMTKTLISPEGTRSAAEWTDLSQPLSVSEENGQIALWCAVFKGEPPKWFEIHLVREGDEFNHMPRTFLGSVFVGGETLHVYWTHSRN